MHGRIVSEFLYKKLMRKIFLLGNGFNEVIIKLISPLFFIRVINKTHAVANVVRILTMS